jgi:hypothetical protein
MRQMYNTYIHWHVLNKNEQDRIIIVSIVPWFECIYWIESIVLTKEEKKNEGGIANSLLLYTHVILACL